MTVTAAPTSLIARHGDTWWSPWWAVALAGQPVDLAAWYLLAQAREQSDSDTTEYEWTVAGGGIAVGSATVLLSSGDEITTGALRLRMRPADWAGHPRRWDGQLEVEMASDGTAAPDERYTIVPARRFQVVSDVSR